MEMLNLVSKIKIVYIYLFQTFASVTAVNVITLIRILLFCERYFEVRVVIFTVPFTAWCSVMSKPGILETNTGFVCTEWQAGYCSRNKRLWYHSMAHNTATSLINALCWKFRTNLCLTFWRPATRIRNSDNEDRSSSYCLYFIPASRFSSRPIYQ